MSEYHRGGNIQNEITLEEHDGVNNAKRVSIVSGDVTVNSSSTVFVGTPTLFAVVNTGAVGVQNSMVTLNAGQNYIGLVTSVIGNLVGNSAGNPAYSQLIYSGNNLTAGQDDSDTVNPGNWNLRTNSGNYIYSGSQWQRVRTASAANATTGIGLLGTGVLGYDGTDYRRIVTGTDGRLQGNVTINNTVAISAPTIFAVVNTAAAGQASVVLDSSVSNIGFATVAVSNTVPVTGTFWQATQPVSGNVGVLGNVTINSSVNSIGFATVAVGSPIAAGVNFIGHATVRIAANANTYIGLVTATVGNTARTITGNVTLSDARTYIGLTTSTIGNTPTVFLGTPTLFAVVNTSASGTTDITSNSGVTVYQGGTWTVTQASSARTITGNLTLSDSKTYIGLTTSTLGVGTQFIGLTTSWSRNAGTTKTLVNLPVGLGNNSLATVAVPTNEQRINTTQLILNSNVTTEIAIRSGVTYLTGNASLGVTLFPGGGFVMNGSPDSPVWISLPSGAMVIEKRDTGGTVSKVAGHVIYFDE